MGRRFGLRHKSSRKSSQESSRHALSRADASSPGIDFDRSGAILRRTACLGRSRRVAKKVNYPTTYMAADERARLLIATGRAREADSALDAFHPPTAVPGAVEMDSLKVHLSRAENALARGENELAARLAHEVLLELSTTNARDYL